MLIDFSCKWCPVTALRGTSNRSRNEQLFEAGLALVQEVHARENSAYGNVKSSNLTLRDAVTLYPLRVLVNVKILCQNWPSIFR